MFAVGNSELGEKLGATVWCRKCGGRHRVKYSERALDDGSRVRDGLLAFVKCGGKAYIIGVNGRQIGVAK